MIFPNFKNNFEKNPKKIEKIRNFSQNLAENI
jgi:hypothetical protein